MPSPDGCFVQVWDAPKFVGTTDYLNGPLVYSTLQMIFRAPVFGKTESEVLKQEHSPASPYTARKAFPARASG